jgi:hypothetical protein
MASKKSLRNKKRKIAIANEQNKRVANQQMQSDLKEKVLMKMPQKQSRNNAQQPASLKDTFKQKGAENLADRFFSGSGKPSGNGSTPSVNSGGFGKGIIILIVLAILFLGAEPLYSSCNESGFCKVKVVDPLKDSLVPIKKGLGFVGTQLDETAKIISGERSFDWEGNVENRVRSGVWFEKGRSYGEDALVELGIEGKDYQTVGNEFGAYIDLVVGKLDPQIDKVNAKINCSLLGNKDRAQGFIREYENGKIILDNPFEKEKESRELVCSFERNKAKVLEGKKEGKTYFSGDILFELTYGLSPSMFLPVFVISNDETYFNQYAHRSNSAFEELLSGTYDEYSSGVKSTMLYDTDVKAYMRFVNQPLFTEKGNTFGVQFKNEDLSNNVTIKGFGFNLTKGLRISGTASYDTISEDYFKDPCQYFVFKEVLEDGRRRYELNENYFKKIENQLNSRDGLTDLYLCRVDIENYLGEDIILSNIGEIEGNLNYVYTVTEKVRITN